MMKGMKDLVESLVLEVKGTFEEDYKYSIRKYKVCGITVKKRLFPSDKKERYFHIYYNERMRSSEHEKIEQQKIFFNLKYKYEAALAELDRLHQKRSELKYKELLKAIENSNRLFEEIMAFLDFNDEAEE